MEVIEAVSIAKSALRAAWYRNVFLNIFKMFY